MNRVRHRINLALRLLQSVTLVVGTCLFFTQRASAEQEIKLAVFDTVSYPLNILDQNNHLVGGLLKDFGDAIAREIGATPVYTVYSRRRVEQSLTSGQADIVCYFSPQWSEHREQFLWSLPNLPQIERIVVSHDKPMLNHFPQQLMGKKIATRLGYFYPQISKEVAAGKIQRIDLTDVPGMFRLVALGGADGLVSSEAEIEGYFKSFPEQRDQFTLSKTPFSVLSTQCGVSRKSSWKIEQINRAISHIQSSGEQDTLLHRYGFAEK